MSFNHDLFMNRITKKYFFVQVMQCVYKILNNSGRFIAKNAIHFCNKSKCIQLFMCRKSSTQKNILMQGYKMLRYFRLFNFV